MPAPSAHADSEAHPPPPPEWDLHAALGWLNAKVNFERRPNRDLAVRVLKLDRMRALAAALGDPHLLVPSIHVAGSKGKGSITRMAASILSAAGLRTGAFTSPHLIAPNERIAVDRAPISDADLALAIWNVAQAEAKLPAQLLKTFGQPTYFEAITAAAYDHFARAGCDAAVYEVGLGGRLDSTNILSPKACVLASIELEHTEILGDTLDLIAREKAGILKPGVPAICTPQPPEVLGAFRECARSVGAPLLVLGQDAAFTQTMVDGHAMVDLGIQGRAFAGLRSPLPGAHQGANTAAAVAACTLLLGDRLTEAAMREGLSSTPRDGRMEVVGRHPTIIIDGAHTPASVRAALAAIPEIGGQFVILFGCASDKKAREMLEHIASLGVPVVLTEAGARARPARELLELYAGSAEAMPVAAHALAEARQLAGPDGTVLVLGSFMLAGAVKALVAAN